MHATRINRRKIAKRNARIADITCMVAVSVAGMATIAILTLSFI